MLQGMATGEIGGQGVQQQMEQFWAQHVEGKSAQQLKEAVLHYRAKTAKKKEGQPEMTKIVFALSRGHDITERMLAT
eukprot:8791350-Pyramimonas_sp.AAC.1